MPEKHEFICVSAGLSRANSGLEIDQLLPVKIVVFQAVFAIMIPHVCSTPKEGVSAVNPTACPQGRVDDFFDASREL
jgi:hypothetical protein